MSAWKSTSADSTVKSVRRELDRLVVEVPAAVEIALALDDRGAADVDAREQRGGVVALLVELLELAVGGVEVPDVGLLARERAERRRAPPC